MRASLALPRAGAIVLFTALCGLLAGAQAVQSSDGSEQSASVIVTDSQAAPEQLKVEDVPQPTPMRAQDIQTIFAFGDSYTSVHYKVKNGYEPRGPKQDIRTTSGAKNWIQYLSEHLHVEDSLYDFAVSGSSIEPLVLHAGEAPNPCLINQTDLFEQYFVDKDNVAWDPRTTLFVVASGINDIANSIMLDINYEAKINNLVDIYRAQLQRLVTGGARHFLLMPVPPFDRTPLAMNGAHHSKFVEWVHMWNFRFFDVVSTFQTDNPKLNVQVWDWHSVLDEILDNAKSAYGFKETSTSCWPYARINHYAPAAKDDECRVPMSEYVWKDSAHPTWRVHELLSESVIKLLSEDLSEQVVQTKRELGNSNSSTAFERHRRRGLNKMHFAKKSTSSSRVQLNRRSEPLVVEAGFDRL
ncbi:hypothetical protein OIV83_004636 [Microbotryomycetes sp. JL201]|nr:hypothetical protein OIV83_004636 [Microbotryomycetes sp. JL201]